MKIYIFHIIVNLQNQANNKSLLDKRILYNTLDASVVFFFGISIVNKRINPSHRVAI